jgi:glycosyltransferase involved in cell wall biosynthesis
MRILVATDQWFPDRLGGVARVATETSRRWAARGHEVVVLTPIDPSAPRRQDAEGEPTVLRVLPRGRVPETFSDPYATRRAARRLGGRWDVAVAHTCTTAWGLRRGVDAPLVDVFHADAAAEARFLAATAPRRRDRVSPTLLARPLARFQRMAVRDADAIVLLSEYSRRLLAAVDAAAARRAVRVSGGVDVGVFSPDGRDEARERLGVATAERLVLSVRRLVPRMGLETLLDAAGRLGDVDHLRVAIAGGGPLEGDLRAAADRIGPRPAVELLGRVTEEELVLWLRAADLFVLPTVEHEGFGLATVEALASGTPVVGTPVGATPELLEPLEPRLVARGTDATSIAEAIRTGLELATPELRNRARAHACERYDWDVVMRGWDDALSVTHRRDGSSARERGARAAVAGDLGRD